MTQRILDPNDIAALDHSAIPRFRLPERACVFADRAARLRKLADLNPIAGYLRLMATLADDLASLTLDLLMNEAGYRRSSPNPLLWPELPASSSDA